MKTLGGESIVVECCGTAGMGWRARAGLGVQWSVTCVCTDKARFFGCSCKVFVPVVEWMHSTRGEGMAVAGCRARKRTLQQQTAPHSTSIMGSILAQQYSTVLANSVPNWRQSPNPGTRQRAKGS